MISSSSMSETMRICWPRWGHPCGAVLRTGYLTSFGSREHFGHRSGSASHAFLINSRYFLEGMRRGSCPCAHGRAPRHPRWTLKPE